MGGGKNLQILAYVVYGCRRGDQLCFRVQLSKLGLQNELINKLSTWPFDNFLRLGEYGEPRLFYNSKLVFCVELCEIISIPRVRV